MNNSHNEFHPGTFADSIEHFLFEGKFGWLKKLAWLLSLVVCICFSFFSKEAGAKESNKKTEPVSEFCFKITQVKKGVLLEKETGVTCLKSNEPPPITKTYCKPENWHYVSLGVYQCINRLGNGYRLERKYPI